MHYATLHFHAEKKKVRSYCSSILSLDIYCTFWKGLVPAPVNTLAELVVSVVFHYSWNQSLQEGTVGEPVIKVGKHKSS